MTEVSTTDGILLGLVIFGLLIYGWAHVPMKKPTEQDERYTRIDEEWSREEGRMP